MLAWLGLALAMAYWRCFDLFFFFFFLFLTKLMLQIFAVVVSTMKHFCLTRVVPSTTSESSRSIANSALVVFLGNTPNAIGLTATQYHP